MMRRAGYHAARPPRPRGRTRAASWRTVGTVALLSILAACAGRQERPAGQTTPQAAVQPPGVSTTAQFSARKSPYKIGKPYRINGVWYYPRPQPDYDETGIASWYGHPFHGRLTANGETYDMNALTAAHRTLPLPSKVRVTNLENGRSLVVRVNDRGPFVPGRIIDLSRKSAQMLGVIRNGTAKVRVQLIGDEKDGASRTFVAARPETSEEEKAAVVAAPIDEVQVASLPPPSGVTAAPERVENPLPKPVMLDAPAYAVPAGTPPDESALVVVPVRPTDIYIQAGAFTVFQNAHRLQVKLSMVGKTDISHLMVKERDYFRVRVGPVASVDEADRLLERIITLGHPEARVIVE